MKKYLFLALVALMLITASCASQPQSVVAPTPSPTPTATPMPNEFYTKYINSTKRPVAVMVDNDNSAAWPHAGLSDAYLIYEINVEGGATRLMAFFLEEETEKIGPVRSSRHYFLDYAMEHDAIYAHFGWSPQAQSDISSYGINNINGLFDDAFWRENKYAGDYHSAFTSLERLNSMISLKGYRTERKNAPLNFSPDDVILKGEDAATLKIPYAGFYSVGFEYSKEDGAYKRFMNGTEHALSEEAQIVAKNIIVIYMPQSMLGDGSARINIYNTGSGEGYYLTGGKYVPITWSKSERAKPTEFKDAQGNEILLSPGQTFIEIVPTGIKAVIE